MVVSSHSSRPRGGRILAGTITLALTALVAATLHGMVSHDQLPVLAQHVSSCRAAASSLRLLVLGVIAASWRYLAPWVARRTGKQVERVNAFGWRLLAWAAVLELCIGQDLLGRLFR